MPRSKQVHAAVELSRPALGFSVSEDLGHLQVAGVLDRAALEAWQAVADGGDWLSVECVDEAGDVLRPVEVLDGDRALISVRYEPAAHAAYVFTPEGWRTVLRGDRAVYRVSVVRLAFDDVQFATDGFGVEPWVGAPRPEAAPEPSPDTGPRRQVRCQSSNLMAPRSIRPWILRGDAPTGSTGFEIWRGIAADMIVRALPTELYRDDTVARVALSGQPPRRVDLGEATPDADMFVALQRAAAWVYTEGSDIEVRHTFLTAELAREWKPEQTFGAGLRDRLAPALDSASLVYKAHLRSGSKDTLKALADLRKTLSDEVQKLMQQTRDLSAGVWRDVAVVIGLNALRAATDMTKAPVDGGRLAWVYVMVAAYVGLSYAMSVRTNGKFLAATEASRVAWRTKLYAFLDDADYKALAKQPLDDAIAAYRRTQFWTTVVVMVVIVGLLLVAASDAGLFAMGASADTVMSSPRWFGVLAPFGWVRPPGS